MQLTNNIFTPGLHRAQDIEVAQQGTNRFLDLTNLTSTKQGWFAAVYPDGGEKKWCKL